MDNPEARRPATPPWLFGTQGLTILAGITLLAIALGASEVALLAGGLLVVGSLGRAWNAVALKRVSYARETSTVRAFCGDTLVLETALTNRKPVPLPWVEVWERLPVALEPQGDVERATEHPGQVWLSQGASLWPYQRARWRHPLACRRRGVYRVGEAYVRSGDPFSLFESEALIPGQQEVLVYPRVVPLRRVALPIQHPALDVVGTRSLVTDPTRTAALRDYRPGDSPRLIHWPTTARRGDFQVRVLEPATSLQVTLALDVRGFQSRALYRDTLLEIAISALASIAVYLQQAGSPFGLLANTDPSVELPPGSRATHLEALLEACARLDASRSRPLMPWLHGHLQPGSTVVLAASDASPDLGRNVGEIRAAGHEVLLLLCGADELPAISHRGFLLRLTPHSDLAAVLEGRG